MKKQRVIKFVIFVLTLTLSLCSVFFIALKIHRKNELKNNPIITPKKKVVSHFQCPKNNFYILTLDGGGVRGIISLYFLSEIERLTGKPASQLFNLISGISTGSIIASALLIPSKNLKPKFSANQLLRYYADDTQSIFTRGFLHKMFSLNGLIGPKFSAKGRRQLFDRYYQDTQIGQLLSTGAFYGYDSVKNGIQEFCSWKGCGAIGKNYKLSDIISGTTAAMSFFPPVRFINKKGKIIAIVNDASFSINNPAILSYRLAKKMCPDVKRYFVISIGTGSTHGIPSKDISKVSHWGLLQWFRYIVTTSVEDNLRLSNEAMHLLMEETKTCAAVSPPKLFYIRVNPDLSTKVSSPFDTSKQHIKSLLSIARKYQNKHKESFACLAELLNSKKIPAYCKIDFLVTAISSP